LREIISKTMRPPGFPVKFEEISASFSFAPICRKGFEVGSMKIDPIEISHPNQGLGYKFTEDGKTFVFLTDNELGYRHEGGRNFEEYAAFAKGADVLVHDADYTDEEYPLHRTWGHSTSGQALELAVAAGVSSLGLFHHNQERGDAELDSIVAACGRQLEGRDGAPSSVFAVRPEQEIIL
ncbi:MAG TPA: MBL fold metallo-hydrolase, partial [Elusimicrobiales bacterium]|nr:MBL fold metallo-hydrolase [Elusimicrobiales bacterium]